MDVPRMEMEELRIRLAEAEETLAAIRQGDVDALVVGSEIYSLDSSHAAANRLRQDVQRRRGAAFDLGAFHEQVLGHGTLPVKYLPELVR